MILQNATKDPKELNARTKNGYISVKFAGGEKKEVPDAVVAQLKTNPACMNWFRNKIIVEVKETKEPVKKAEVKEVKTTVEAGKKKSTGKKGKKSRSSDDDLGL